MTVSNNSQRELRDVLPEDHFVSEFLRHASELTDAYPQYHISNALTLLSVAVDRNAKIMVEPKPMFPNYWAILIGHSTVSRKSTSLSIARKILREAELGDKMLRSN